MLAQFSGDSPMEFQATQVQSLVAADGCFHIDQRSGRTYGRASAINSAG